MKRPGLFSLLAVAFAVSFAFPLHAQTPMFERTTAKIAVWNLAGFTSLDAPRIAKQVECLAMLDAEVVALVEVKPASALGDIKAGLAAKGLTYNSEMLTQSSDLNIAVLFKDGVTANNPRFIAGSDLGNTSFRKAFVVDMKVGKFDFILIGVHLKSGRGATQQATRDQQGEKIAEFIKGTLDSSREDILLVGDFNMIPGQDVSNFHHLGGDDMMDFLSSWDLQERFSHILEVGSPNLLDGFAIQRTHCTEYIQGSLRVFPMHLNMEMGLEKFRKDVSDHLPFMATFKIDKDRD